MPVPARHMTDEPVTPPDTSDSSAVVAPVTTEAESVKVSRAGRNLPAAFAVGLSLGAAVIVTLFVIPKWTFVVLATAAVCVGVWELCRALKAGGFDVPVVPSIVGCISMLGAAYVGGAQALLVCFALTCVAILVWRVADGVAGAARDVQGGALVAAYPSFLAAFSSLLLAPDDGVWRMFTFIAITVASDIGGYAVGVLAGRHPMAPTISPKKSWEGFAGSVVFCMAVGVACVHFALHGPWWVGLVAGAAAAVGATGGDLIESTIKRDLGIKDMSNILPGHGGLMDRLDSLVMTAPITWAVLAVLVPVALTS
jgi:phosphatidate cytidylyltransferase